MSKGTKGGCGRGVECVKNGAPLSYLVACHIELLFYGRLARFLRAMATEQVHKPSRFGRHK